MDRRDFITQQQTTTKERMRVVQLERSCPVCEGKEITTTWTIHTFEFGAGESSLELQARVPVRRCNACEFEYLDEESERLKQNAVCDHLGVLTPDEIRRIREDHGMTRASFAQVSGLGEASLNRWENGLSIQNLANDRYLRLLAHTDTMFRLRQMTAAPLSKTTLAGRFRVVEINEELRMDQAAFRLRPVA